ncbi:MAG: hypothetical protein Tsb008_08680 [Rhodothalassiaceae bacterium]
MKKYLLLLAFMLPVLTPAAAHSDADRLLAEAVAEAKQQVVPDRYAYVRRLHVIAEDERVDSRERYDPDRPRGERWTLLEVDGEAPTEKDLRDYDPDEPAGVDIKGADAPSELYSEIVGDIEPREAKLLEETDSYAIFSIDKSVSRFLDDEQAEFKDGIVGRLRLEKAAQGPYVSEVRLYAPKPIRAFIGTGFDRFELTFAFTRHETGGHVLPTRFLFDMDMKALLFISVGVTTDIAFEDWTYQAGNAD